MSCVLGCAHLCVSILVISSITKAQQDCLLATNGQRSLPNFVRPGSGGEPRFRVNPIQAIITSYRFNCCGEVTEWRAFVERSVGDQFDNQHYSVSFQVWRPNSPSPVYTDGCYTTVGVNIFPHIQLADDDGDDRGTVTGVPPLNERIEVRPGDVVGFYLESSRNDDDGTQFAGDDDNDPDYTSESVWYATGTITAQMGSCPLPIGPDHKLSMFTNRAPLITATVSMSPCPVPTSIPLSHSSQSTLPITPSTSSHEPLTPTLQPTPTPTDTTTSGPVGTADNVGLHVGIAVPVSVLVVGGIVMGVVILCCVVTNKDKRSRTPASLKLTESNLLSRDETAPTTEANETYRKLNEATPTSQPVVYDYIDPPTIPVTQNQAYGDISTRADTDYYVNEGLGGAAELRMDRNEAYGVSRGAPSDNESSTERVEEETTYDYARVV